MSTTTRPVAAGKPRFVVLPDLAAVAVEAADRFVESARAAISARGVFRVALSGGTTPNAVYPLLRSEPRVSRVDWSRVEFFWGDERAVPPDDPESNFGTAYRMFISQLPGLRPEAIHRMQGEATDLDAAALTYETELRLAFGVRGDQPPQFDLILLGLGPDGHTASIFVGSSALRVKDRWVAATWVPSRQVWRLTITYPVIAAAREVLFLATGANKANALRHIRRGGSPLPAARVQARRVVWLIDAAAAGSIAPTGSSAAPERG
jgi:6-phosphogluconolactonase